MSTSSLSPGALGAGVLVVCAGVLTAMNVVTHRAIRERRLGSWTPVAEWRNYKLGGIHTGPDSAPVTIVEFADYGCQPCRHETPLLRDALAQFPQNVALVVHEIPFEGPESDSAAAGAYCAMDDGRFLQFEAALVATKALSSLSITEYAKRAGIWDLHGFMKCIGSDRVKQALALDRQEATKLGVRTTPLLLINDKEFILPPDPLPEAIARELKETSTTRQGR